jgi:iron complex outermembrane receptor protein
MTTRIIRLAVLGFTGMLAIPRLTAQERSDTARTVAAHPVVIEALRVPNPVDSVPFAVTSIDAPPARPGLSLGEILSAAPGLQVDNRFNYAVGDRISIRGFGARTQFGVRGIKVIVDGIPATFADGQSALEGIAPASIEHAEVEHGPASALFGNAAGGVVTLRTERAPRAPLYLSARPVFGSFGYMDARAMLAGTVDSTTLYYDNDVIRYDGFREHSRSRNTILGGGLRSRLSERSEIHATLGRTSFDADNPGSLTRAAAEADPRAAFATNVAQGTGKSGTQNQGGLGWSTTVGATALDVDAYLIGRRISNPIIGRVVELDRTAGGARLQANGSLPYGSLAWAAGADLDLQADDRRNYGNAGGSHGDLLLDQFEHVTSAGGFLQLALPLPGELRAMGNLRYDRVRFSVRDHFITANDPDDSGIRSMGGLSPSLGLLWSPADALQLYGNVGTSFETPTTTELANRPDGAGGFNPDLQPQHALSIEGGARARIAGWISGELTLYSVALRDELIPFEVPSDPGRDYYRNAGSALHRGLEISTIIAPAAGIRARVAYAWTDARFRSYAVDGHVYDGNRVPGVAPNRLDATISAMSSSGWFAAVDLRGVSPVPVNDANSESAPGYFLCGARIGTESFDAGTLLAGVDLLLDGFVGVENLLDRRYFASVTVNAAGGRYYEPGAGRSFYAGINLRLEKK